MTKSTNNYSELQDYKCSIEIRIKRQKEYHTVEYFDGVRLDPSTLPEGKHMYHTRHSDSDMAYPVAITPEGTPIIVNFCGTIVTDEPLKVTEEIKIMDVNWL